MNIRLGTYIATVAALAAAVAFAGRDLDAPAGTTEAWPALALLAALVVAAEYLLVRFRVGGEVNAMNLMEAVLAPVVIFYPPSVAVATVAASQIVAAIVRRNAPTKAAFNVAQWSLATGCGALVAATFAPATATAPMAAGVLLALVVVATVNQVAFTLVVTIANRQRLRRAVAALRPVMLRGWAASWLLNSAIGLLFVFAFDRHAVAVLLFPVPLVVLHLAYRGYAGARTDRIRLTGVHHAVSVLSEPIDPREKVVDFLVGVATSFDARAAVLAIRNDGVLEVHEVERATRNHSVTFEPLDQPSLVSSALTLDRAARVTASSDHPLRPYLRESDVRDVLAAPLVEGDVPLGALLVVDQGGLEGFEEGELAVLDALARETAGVFAKGRLFATVLEERRATAEIVDSTSDGILTIDDDGMIRAWNPALAAITGFTAADAVGHPVSLVLRATSTSGDPVPLDRWANGEPLPSQIEVVAADGSRRRLSCSYGYTATSGEGKLVVIARDLTPAEQFEELREQLGRLVEVEAAHRAVVAALQEALLPARPEVAGAEFAVAYVPSDEQAPTGGDLYDWQVLPDGWVHVAVIDVLGHGVTATKHALAVISTLRLLALQGCALEDMVRRADELLRSQDPELVATVVIARVEPRTGAVHVVAGGHPPALLVRSEGAIEQISAPGIPIGWPEAASDACVELALHPGDSLVLYTDGLIEARRNILDGLDELVAHAQALSTRAAQELADELVARALAGADRRDDSLALVIRRAPQLVLPATRRWTFGPELTAVRSARRAVADFLAQAGVAEEAVSDALLITSELVTNGMRAPGCTSLSLVATVTEDALVLDAVDDGQGDPSLADAGHDLPDLDGERGRGLYLVRAVADDMSILSTAEGTSVRVQCSLRASAPAPQSGAEPRR
ncbi:MAG TPA: SpoIIE family protein phosphatase [Acidimicrobiales bacterium]|nr:SpoIIE family protein phosphatase [Acidimicrobiales bacterium]